MKQYFEKFYSVNWPRWLMWLIPALTAMFLLLFRLSDIAGLHRDEAAFGLFAETILNGFRPVRGFFNIYTSPIHSYIIAVFFSVFGESIWSLRVSGVLLNLLAVWAYIDVVRRLFPKRAVWTLWLLITLPAFVVMARISGENYALNPLFLFGGIWSYYVLGLKGTSKWISAIGYGLAGLFFYLGVWNHIVFIPTVASVVIVYLIFSRIKISRMLLILRWFLLGAFIGAIPKIYGVLALGYDWIPHLDRKMETTAFSTMFLNMLYTFGGDALYIRACGEILFSFNWFLPLCALASAGILIRARVPTEQKKMWIAVALCIILSFVGTWLITPAGTIGSRFWLLPLWFTPLLLSLSLPVSNKWLRIGLGTAIVLINITAISVNYFYNFLQDGGIAKKSVYVGGRYDNSWDFIDMRPLVNKLSSFSDKPIYIEDFTDHRLRFLLPKASRDRVHTIRDATINKRIIPIHSLIASYNTEGRNAQHITLADVIAVRKPELSTSHYQVYMVIGTKKR